MILNDVLEHIGNTPMVKMESVEAEFKMTDRLMDELFAQVRVDRLASEYGIACNLYCKCEYFNAGGSVKDRIGRRMVQQAEKDGRLIKGKSVVIEPTSGNTGIALALACAVYGYKCIICLPEKMSQEKQTVLQALGAEVVRTPTEAAYDDPRSHIQVARRLEKEIPYGIVLDQYVNTANPLAHYYGTAEEIIEDIKSTYVEPVSRPRKNTLDRLVDGSSRLAGLPGTGATSKDMERQKSGGSEKESLSSSPGKAKTRPRGNTLDQYMDMSSMLGGLPFTTTTNGHNERPVVNGKDDLSKPMQNGSASRPSNGKLDVLFAGAGTGGSISGMSKRLKEEWSDVTVVGIDPIGSILAQPETLNELKEGESAFYKVEGIGYEFIPDVLDRKLVDVWLKVNDDSAFKITRKLIRTEGLLVGGSSGCAMAGAIRWLTETEEGKAVASDSTRNVVVLMPDSIRNYITKPWLLQEESDN